MASTLPPAKDTSEKMDKIVPLPLKKVGGDGNYNTGVCYRKEILVYEYQDISKEKS